MTVGKEGDMTVFPQLCSLRDEVSTKLSIPASDIELSMGMSADFLKAVTIPPNKDRIRLNQRPSRILDIRCAFPSQRICLSLEE